MLPGPTLTAEANVTVGLAPAVAIHVQNNSNTANQATITLANGGSWTGYTVGEGIFVGSASGDNNANGATFNAGSSNPYYKIIAINGPTLTVSGKFNPEKRRHR